MKCISCNSNHIQTGSLYFAPFLVERIWNGQAPVAGSVSCLDCGIQFSAYRPTKTELQNLYSGYRSDEYNYMRLRHEPGYAGWIERLKQPHTHLQNVDALIAKHISPLRILDYGGDDGKNTPLKGIAHADVYDISEMGNVREIEDVYDLVTCLHVLEHVSYPQEILRDIKEKCPNAWLYVEVPKEPMAHWWHEHINVWTPKALRQCVELCGYQYVSDEAVSPDIFSILGKPR